MMDERDLKEYEDNIRLVQAPKLNNKYTAIGIKPKVGTILNYFSNMKLYYHFSIEKRLIGKNKNLKEHFFSYVYYINKKMDIRINYEKQLNQQISLDFNYFW